MVLMVAINSITTTAFAESNDEWPCRNCKYYEQERNKAREKVSDINKQIFELKKKITGARCTIDSNNNAISTMEKGLVRYIYQHSGTGQFVYLSANELPSPPPEYISIYKDSKNNKHRTYNKDELPGNIDYYRYQGEGQDNSSITKEIQRQIDSFKKDNEQLEQAIATYEKAISDLATELEHWKNEELSHQSMLNRCPKKCLVFDFDKDKEQSIDLTPSAPVSYNVQPNIQMVNEYIHSRTAPAIALTNQTIMRELDQSMNMLERNKVTFNETRGVYNVSNSYYTYDNVNFNTDSTGGLGTGNRIQQLSILTKPCTTNSKTVKTTANKQNDCPKKQETTLNTPNNTIQPEIIANTGVNKKEECQKNTLNPTGNLVSQNNPSTIIPFSGTNNNFSPATNIHCPLAKLNK